MKENLRWIAVFPGALVAGILATFLLHWVLYVTLANGETISGVDTKPIEYMLYPFVIAITFIFTGYKIAPKNKFKTATVLFIIYLIAWLIVSFIALSRSDIHGLDMKFSGRTILALVGAIVGLYIAKRVDSNMKKIG